MSKHDKPVLNPAPGYCKHCKQYTIEEPLPAEPVQEPVAWVECDGDLVWNNRDAAIGRNLYTAPPQRKPLTEKEIEALFEAELLALPSYPSATEELPVRLARAIERAHGIGGQP